ncbi:MAG TPA: nicotinate-nucleotide--dimethylbenzimidazole phosphoribosyltransferase [Steroidobacteraceae bacterium]
MTRETLQRRLDSRTKPQGSLGQLEALGIRIGLALDTDRPRFTQPTIMVFAADHGIANDAVSAFPSAVTGQMLANYLSGGAAINVLARQHGLALQVVDAGVASDVPSHPGLTSRSIARGTRNFRLEPAMTAAQCEAALNAGRELAGAALRDGSNALLLGEMGIGNTACASLILHRRTGWPLADCVGRGTGLDDAALERKTALLAEAAARVPGELSPQQTLTEFGGFEIAMLTGAVLEAAQHRCIVVVDGFAVSVAASLAMEMDANVARHCVFSHCSAEKAHRALLARLDVRPLLDLNLRLGEGSGAALAWPLIDATARLMSEMASFESAGVADRSA